MPLFVFAERGSGLIVGISSVSGDRGRAKNYVYGAAKAGFTAYLSGLRCRFAHTAIRIITVKPGFVRTRMTAGMDLPAALTAAPEEVAAAVRAQLNSPRRRFWRGLRGAGSSWTCVAALALRRVRLTGL